jgi:hypothetical protein
MTISLRCKEDFNEWLQFMLGIDAYPALDMSSVVLGGVAGITSTAAFDIPNQMTVIDHLKTLRRRDRMDRRTRSRTQTRTQTRTAGTTKDDDDGNEGEEDVESCEGDDTSSQEADNWGLVTMPSAE